MSDVTQYVDSWFCDLHMGGQAYLSSSKHLSRLDWKQDFEISPGDFGLLITEERVNIPPDLAAFISLRFQIALRGLVNISGRHVDPGYKGRLVFSVYNAGVRPVVLRRGDPIFMITFAKLDHVVPDRHDPRFVGIDSIKAEWMEYVKGPPVSLVKLHKQVDRLEIYLWALMSGLGGLSIAVAAGLILGLLHW
ncbi:MAG: hypothetical protein L3K10_03265 [Thermoplasmata archaeon]|nr:hypothetical protein [Thermoplasmata archaeon]